MSFADHLLLYCERHGSGLFAEPLNALSNLAFFVAAWKLWPSNADRSRDCGSYTRLLATLIALVGAGSLAFHTFATAWASVLDVAFIGVFNLCYLVIFLRVVLGAPRVWAFVAAGAFLLVDRFSAALFPADALNGSVLYLPAIAVLMVITTVALRAAPAAGRMMAGAAAVFVVSLAARTIDRVVCDAWPWGTHFIWHVLNAWVLYRLSRALQASPRAAAPGR